MLKELSDFQGTDRFIIEHKLGVGSFGTVYQAFDRERGTAVALKTLRLDNARALYRFKREFRALANVVHPNLISLYELISDGAEWFFTMELVQGVDFLNYVRDTRLAPGFNEERLRRALKQLVAGVSALHAAGMLHRDLKPSNVLVTAEGRVVILDFGLVTDLSAHNGSTSGDFVGTPNYMAPEQAMGDQCTAAVDWYGIGVMLYEALTGALPFSGQFVEVLLTKQQCDAAPPNTLVPGIPEDLNRLCIDLLNRDAHARPGGKEILSRLKADPSAVTVTPPARLPVRTAPLLRREAHLRLLSEAFAGVRRGHAVAVCVRGASGMGKSTLIRMFLDNLSAQERETVILTGKCYEQESVPYKALDSIVDALSQYLKRLPGHEAAAFMPRDVQALARLFPVLKQVEAVAGGQRRVLEITDSQELRRRAFAALRELLCRMSDKRSLVMFIDDLQWGDSDSAALLTEILRPPDAPLLLLIVTYRSEEVERNTLLRSLLQAIADNAHLDRREISVAELEPAEARELALSLLDSDSAAAQARADTIARESAGSPFFIYELARFALSDLPARAPDGTAGLDQFISARVEQLPAESRRLLEILAVAGQPLALASARQAAGCDNDHQLGLAALRADRLVKTVGLRDQDEIEIYHDRIRETLLARLTPEQSCHCHHQLALALEKVAGIDPERLAVHFRAAGDNGKAAEFAALAADNAAEALAFDRAARLYRLALELTAAISTASKRQLQGWKVKLGDALTNAGRGVEAAQVYLDAAAGANAADRLDLRRRAAEQYLISGHIDAGLATIREVLAMIGLKLHENPRMALLSLLLRRAWLKLRGLGYRERDESQLSAEELIRIDTCHSVALGLGMVDVIRSAEFHTRHLLLALRAGEPYRILRALATETAFSSIPGSRSSKRTAAITHASMKMAERSGDQSAIAYALFGSAIAALNEGRWHDTRGLCERAAALFRDNPTGLSHELDVCHIFLLRALYYLGELAEMRARYIEPLKHAQRRGDLYAETNIRTRVSYLVALVEDDPERARHELRDGIARWSQQGFHAQHYFSFIGEIEILLYCDMAGAAWEVIERSWPILKGSLMLECQFILIESFHLRARCALAVAAANARARAQMLKRAERDAARIEREHTVWSKALAMLIRAGCASLRAESRPAIELFQQAEELLRADGMGLYAAIARRRRGQLVGRDGETLVTEADEWMRKEQITRPDRFANMLVPGHYQR